MWTGADLETPAGERAVREVELDGFRTADAGVQQREISSRSVRESRQADRGRGTGARPPVDAIGRRTASSDRSIVRLIDRMDSPV